MTDDAALATLCEAFPSLKLADVAEALRVTGNADAAAALLVQQHCSERSTLGKKQHRASWGTLTAAAGQAQRRLPVAPRYHAPAASQPVDGVSLSTTDFPEALLPAFSSCADVPAGAPQPQQWGAARQRLAHEPRHVSIAYRQVRQAGQQRCQQEQHTQQQWHQAQHRQHRQSAGQQLLEQHGWAGPELVAAVLAAMQGDAGAASAALADIAAGGTDSQPAHVQQPPQQPGSIAAAPRGCVPPGSETSGSMPGSASGCCDGDGGSRSLPARWDGWGDEEECTEEEQADPYYRFRRQALQLSRRWQRAGRRAAAAFSAGQHGTARQLAVEAHRLRSEALAAHAEAAERIEMENNQHNGLFELDLHGLHSQEALAALERRLDLLHSLLADPASGAAAGGTGRTLRVVVGRGAHSNGEASLPRVVTSYLVAGGMRFRPLLGALDVQLRTAAALRAAGEVGGASSSAAARGSVLHLAS